MHQRLILDTMNKHAPMLINLIANQSILLLYLETIFPQLLRALN